MAGRDAAVWPGACPAPVAGMGSPVWAASGSSAAVTAAAGQYLWSAARVRCEHCWHVQIATAERTNSQ